MELSKEVHNLLDRIKKLTQHAQNTENQENICDSRTGQINEKIPGVFINSYSEVFDENEELIQVDIMDFSDSERWLYVSANPMIQPHSGNLMNWLKHDVNRPNNSDTENEKMEFKRIIDTRTFTRPKKRLSRPSIEQLTEGYLNHDGSRKSYVDSIPENINKSTISEDLFENNDSMQSSNISNSSGPLHFKLSEPVYNSSFDRILASAKNCIDSFQNMSPPSLMNSLCSSTMMDSSYLNTEHVPNTSSELNAFVFNETVSVNENIDPNVTSTIDVPKCVKEKDNTFIEAPINATFDRIPQKITLDLVTETIQNRTFDRIPQNKSIEAASNRTFDRIPQNKCIEAASNRTFDRIPHNKSIETASNRTFDRTPQNNSVQNASNQTFDRIPQNKSIETASNRTFDRKLQNKSVDIGDYTKAALNETYDRKPHNKTVDVLNGTYSKSSIGSLNTTYEKNVNNKISKFGYQNFSGTNTFTRKPKLEKFSTNLKSSCPDITRTFSKGHDYALDATFQKISDSEPNLTEELKRTILNQSMELMHPVIESYTSARSGSADSLDERSSSISNSSKESGTKIMNMSDLENLAKMQEQSLHQVMSTPKPTKSPSLSLWEEDVLSPIHNRLVDQAYLSDSDLSDSYMTARSGFSKRTVKSAPLRKSLESVAQPNVNVTRFIPNKPQMVVKPLPSNEIVPPNRPQSALVRPKIRMSGLPRPTGIPGTGIPRPTSRIPGPRTTR